MSIAYRWWGRVVVCCVVIGCVEVLLILQFTLHKHGLRDSLPMDAFLVATSHVKVLKCDTHG